MTLAVYTVDDVASVLEQAEQFGWISEDQHAQLAGLFIAKKMSVPPPGQQILEVEA